MTDRAAHLDCVALFDGHTLTLETAAVRRAWTWDGSRLTAGSFVDLATGHEWCARPSDRPSLVPPAGFDRPAGELRMAARAGRVWPTEVESLIVELRGPGADGPAFCFQSFPETPGVTVWLRLPPAGATPGVRAADEATGAPTGVEVDPAAAKAAEADDVIEAMRIRPRHVRLTAVELFEQTDGRNNLVFEPAWDLHPAERAIVRRGTLFHLHRKLSDDGLILLKLAPQPYARPVKPPSDFELAGDALSTRGHGVGPDGGDGYRSVVLAYAGGYAGRVAALQRYQRQLRPYVPGRDGRFVTNTWGDRSKDGRVSEAFMGPELAAAARLGADVVQVDDGWQRGRSANSVVAGGTWNGFWAADANFWAPHPERFPNGLRPAVDAAAGLGLRVGLWYAPDSSNDAANWRRDADQVLRLHRGLSVDFVKIDAIKMHSKACERNVLRFYDAVLAESGCRVTFDHDVTAEVRPGYFGSPHVGPVFVENRYTDWGRYWPHATLRNLWQLARHVDPVRLRMEFLNNARNADKYADDPLAPAAYGPAYLFATVMFASPLGWFECSNLPEAYVDAVGRLARVWREHRDAIFGGAIVPLGHPPDGTAWTGFASSTDARTGYLLVFRELNDRPTATIDVPMFSQDALNVELLAGDGTARVAGGKVTVALGTPLSFLFAKVS